MGTVTNHVVSLSGKQIREIAQIAGFNVQGPEEVDEGEFTITTNPAGVLHLVDQDDQDSKLHVLSDY